jgi:hypothetical protein
MADRDAWLAEALGTLTAAEADILRVAAGLMDRLADVCLEPGAPSVPPGQRRSV